MAVGATGEVEPAVVAAKVAAEASVAWVVEVTQAVGLGETARGVVLWGGAAAGASAGRVG